MKILSTLFTICCIFINVTPLFDSSVMAQANTIKITGSVIDYNGEAVIGATIIQEGTQFGATTNAKGEFSINIKSKKAELVISCIGFADKKIAIGNRSYLKVTLEESAIAVEEVTVVAYGVQKKATLTGAISSVGTKDLLKTPSTSITNSLAGQMPGVSTVQSSGQPGADNAQIFIRGSGTLSDGAAKPLTLVDGVEMAFSQMDPNEIESITVLKDASATAVFGVRGANGVILVTTRRGAEGSAQISLTSTVGVSRPTRVVDTADSYTYATLYNEMNVNDGKDINDLFFSPYVLDMFKTNANPTMYPSIDWSDYLNREASLQTQHNINVSGGTKTVKYFVSMGYLYQDGLFKDLPGLDYDNNYRYERYNYRANLDVKVTPTTDLKINIGGVLGKTHVPYTGDNNVWDLLNNAQPFSSPGVVDGRPMNTDGRYFGGMIMTSGLNAIYARGYQDTSKNTMNLNLELSQDLKIIAKGLSVSVKGAYNTYYTYGKSRSSKKEWWTPHYASAIDGSGMNPGDEGYDYDVVYRTTGKDGSRTWSDSASKDRDWYMEASLRYNNKFGDHNVGALLLYNQSKNYFPGQFTAYPTAYVGVVGRVTYDYKSKYLADFNVGYNGSENFAPNNRYGLFPAMSAGWVLTEEDFMKESSIVSYMKIRASCGLVGNDNMSGNRYLYLPDKYVMNDGGYNFGIDIPQNSLAAYEGKLGNPNVVWETALKQNYGIDVHFFKSKLQVSVDYFRESREDILISRKTIPTVVALDWSTLPVVNLGKVKNSGFEFNVNWDHNIRDFSYWINANGSFARNKIMFMDEVRPVEPYMAQTGQQTGLNYGYVADGFYDYNDFDDHKTGVPNSNFPDPGNKVYPGDVIYKDLNGDGVVNAYDQKFIGSPNRPEFVYGLNYGFRYKGFELTMSWSGAALRSVPMTYTWRIPYGETAIRSLKLYMAEGRWTQDTQETATMPRFSQTSSKHNYKNSSLWIKDASYFRLKNAQLGYTFAGSKLKKIGISKLHLYINGYNLLTFDKLGYMDPEFSPNHETTYPITQIYNLGVNLTF